MNRPTQKYLPNIHADTIKACLQDQDSTPVLIPQTSKKVETLTQRRKILVDYASQLNLEIPEKDTTYWHLELKRVLTATQEKIKALDHIINLNKEKDD